MQIKMVSQKTEAKQEAFPVGQACPLPGKGGIGSAKGAMGSAAVTLIL